jgi:hypothetical protein
MRYKVKTNQGIADIFDDTGQLVAMARTRELAVRIVAYLNTQEEVQDINQSTLYEEEDNGV